MMIRVVLDVNNLTPGYGERYIVARLVDGELWAYGRYKTKMRAQIVASELKNAIVMELVEGLVWNKQEFNK